MGIEAPPLSLHLVDRALGRLGLPHAPRPDPDGLETLYRAWCARVPFDNLRRMTAIRRGDAAPLPGGEPADFLERFLEDGVGGTCWPSSNALHAMLCACGFDARRVAGCMRDLGIVNHGSVVVRFGGEEYLADSSMLTNRPLPLLPSAPFLHDDPVFRAETEPVEGGWLLWTDVPPTEGATPCRLRAEPVDHAFYARAYDASRARSPFNDRLYARRNRPGEMLVLRGRQRIRKRAEGTRVEDLSRAQVLAALRDDIGASEDAIAAWVDAGGLDATLAPPPPDAPQPSPVAGRPPSRRAPV
jgi:N-hydroxyarylamine O-acetyltransferase